MFFFYEILAITFLLFSPIIFAVRIIIGKEDFNRFLEKFCIYKKYNKNQTIWFHGASVGPELEVHGQREKTQIESRKCFVKSRRLGGERQQRADADDAVRMITEQVITARI